MPEMVGYYGQRFTVDRIADKVCDSARYIDSRKMPDAVLLVGQRCDGSGHGHCQASCRVFWKNAWLRKVAAGEPPAAPPAPQELEALLKLAQRAVRHDVATEKGAEQRWRCQLTELHDATERVPLWNPRSYFGQYTNGNVTLAHCARVTARAAIEEPLRRLGLMPRIFVKGTATGPVKEILNLQPGEWVQVRSKQEILTTLTPEGFNRGMWFDREMTPYCGGTFRVKQRVTRFIDDIKDVGRMVELTSDAVTLEGVVCSGELSMYRWLCPRQVTPYWRECWLRRVDPPPAATRSITEGSA
jgi:hypothetical protein